MVLIVNITLFHIVLVFISTVSCQYQLHSVYVPAGNINDPEGYRTADYTQQWAKPEAYYENPVSDSFTQANYYYDFNGHHRQRQWNFDPIQWKNPYAGVDEFPLNTGRIGTFPVSNQNTLLNNNANARAFGAAENANANTLLNFGTAKEMPVLKHSDAADSFESIYENGPINLNEFDEALKNEQIFKNPLLSSEAVHQNKPAFTNNYEIEKPTITSELKANDSEEETAKSEEILRGDGKYFSSLSDGIMGLLKVSAARNFAPRIQTDVFDFLRDKYPLPKGIRGPLAEYDYVIVGAGSGGSVLASRLTEDKPRATVLLIEAGKPEMLLTDVPALAPAFQATDYATQYYMEYQPGVCMGMLNQRCFWPRGRAVGGTSVINYMIYTRGRPQEWDRIAADGNYGWSYKDVLRYYIKSEKANLRNYTNLPYRGRDGKQSVEYVPFRTRLVSAFLEAGRLLGHPTVDYNDPNSFGFGYVQATMVNGHRQSPAKAFLHPHKGRRNLHILPETFTTKVLIDPRTKRAYGVEYVRNRLKYTVKARREVILSAGPIASPQLLMLSGIGPKEHLKSHNIPVIKDLPVGRTLYDHITFPGVIFKLNTTNISLRENTASNIRSFKNLLAQWTNFGDGILSSPGGVEGIGYIKTPVSDDPEQVPDIELIDIGGSLVSDAGPGSSEAVRRGMRISKDVFDSAFSPLFNMDTWSAFPMLLHPQSRGNLELRDANPFSFPKLYGNYLTERKDVDTFIAAIRHIIALAETPPFQKFGAQLHPADYPTCRQHQFNSDGYWECAVRTLTATLHHQIATCKMGPVGDPTAVVDPELRVHGIKGLRVVDTSIIPRTTSAHTNAPGMMIGEKAADLIKQTWANLN